MLMAQFRIASLWWWIVDGLQTNRFEGVKNCTFMETPTATTQGFRVRRSEEEVKSRVLKFQTVELEWSSEEVSVSTVRELTGSLGSEVSVFGNRGRYRCSGCVEERSQQRNTTCSRAQAPVLVLELPAGSQPDRDRPSH